MENVDSLSHVRWDLHLSHCIRPEISVKSDVRDAASRKNGTKDRCSNKLIRWPNQPKRGFPSRNRPVSGASQSHGLLAAVVYSGMVASDS